MKRLKLYFIRCDGVSRLCTDHRGLEIWFLNANENPPSRNTIKRMAAHTVRLHHNLTLQSSIFIVIILLLLSERFQLEATSLQGDILPTTIQSTITTTIQDHFSQSTAIFFSTPASKIYTNDTTANQSFSSQNETLSFLWFPGKNSHYSTAVAVFITLILLCVIVGTIVGNILVCVAVCLVRKLRRPCNYLLVSLAVSDLCVAILVMPMAMLYEILGNWPFGPVFCDLWVSFDVLSCTASILNLCMISVDRYYAITKPLEYGVKRTPRRMIFCVFLVWLGAACISLPPLLILGNEREESHCIVCQNFGYQIYATLGSFYIPLLVMIVVYYKIFRAARKIVMEEKRAQSHLESHCYLEINVKNGGGAESKLLGRQATPANARSSSVATNASVSSILSSIFILLIVFHNGEILRIIKRLNCIRHNGRNSFQLQPVCSFIINWVSKQTIFHLKIWSALETSTRIIVEN